MAITKLCKHDEGALEDILGGLRDKLEEIGIEGDMFVLVKQSGDVFADIYINKDTCLKLTICDDGNETNVRYMKNGDNG